MHLSNNITSQQTQELLTVLKERFENVKARFEGLLWETVLEKLLQHPEKLWSLNEMEQSGGEPNLVYYDNLKEEFHFYDCAPESPLSRKSLCYDREALESRKENKPVNSAIDVAAAMGIEILDEAQYRFLQTLGKFDTKTSSWIKTPEAIRKLDGALFCDFRYNTVFVYHNSASSYYAARGFRGCLKI